MDTTMTVMTESTATAYQLGRWDLSDLLPDAGEAAVNRHLAHLEAAVSAFESRRDTLLPSMPREELHRSCGRRRRGQRPRRRR